MKNKVLKFVILSVLVTFVVTMGVMVYSNNKSSKEIPKRAKLVERDNCNLVRW